MYGRIIIIMCLITPPLMAETNAFDPFAISKQPPQSQSSIVNGVLDKELHSADEAAAGSDLNTDEVSGRDKKLGSAAKQAETGSKVAATTGIALMMAGFPMVFSGIPSLIAAGGTLIGLGGTEIKQSIDSAATSAENNARKNALTTGNDDSNGSQTTVNEIKKALDNPALDKLLADRGINAEDFKNKMASGALTDAESIRNALGDTTQFSAEDLAAGESLAQATLNDVIKEVHGDPTSLSVGINEGSAANSSNPEGKGEGGTGSVSSLAAGESKSNGSLDGKTEAAHATGSFASGNNSKTATAGSENAMVAGAGFDPNGFLSKFLGKDVLAKFEKEMPGLLRANLERLGIMVPTSKQHIFQTAHRNFRSFAKWRRSYRVAMGSNAQ